MKTHTETKPTTVPQANTQQLVDQLVALLELEDLGSDRFLGQSAMMGYPAVFGGQVVAQALGAAQLTVDRARVVHSLHSYFLLPGEFSPIEYVVNRVRDGRNFSTRSVTAHQKDNLLFEMQVSFQTPETGVEYQKPMPEVPPVGSLRSEIELRRLVAHRLPEPRRSIGVQNKAMEVYPVDPIDPIDPPVREPQTQMWVRAAAPLPDDPWVHRQILAYTSDHGLLVVGLRPHALSYLSGRARLASLDHSMWFHREFRADQWLLYCVESINANGSRMLCRGNFYTQEGLLVASTAQEGLVRLRRTMPPHP